LFSSWSALIISYQGEGNMAPIDHWMGVFDELAKEVSEFPSEEIETRVAGAMLSAIATRQPGHPDGARWAERALSLSRCNSDLTFRAITALTWFYYHYQLGNCAKASVVADEMRLLMRARDVSPIVAVNASMTVALYEFAYLVPSYRQTVADMLALVRTTGMLHIAMHVTLSVGIRAALSDGDLETADIWIREMGIDLDSLGLGYRDWYYMFITRAALLRGDLDKAAALRPEMVRLCVAAGAPLGCVEAFLVSAEVLGCQGKAQDARSHLDAALEIAHTTGSSYFEFMARLAEAHLCFDSAQETEGIQALRIGIALGKAGDYVNSFVWQPAVMAKLCAKALEANIEVEYVQGLIRKRKLVPKEAPSEIEAWPWPVKIYTLGRFKVLKDDQPLQFAGKVQRKPLALLKAMIAFGGRHVREELLIDALWPDADGDAARFALTSALHRLRKLLGHEEAIIRKDNEIGLDDRYCWIDTWAAERLVARSETASRGNGEERSWQQATELIQRALALYRGSFLSNDPEATWGMTLADRLRRRLLRQLKLIGERHEEKEQLQQAADLYEEALRVDICAEDVCRRLMILYHQLGRPSEVASIYRQCREALNSQFGINLSAETEELLKTLRSSFGSQAAVGK
jgi:DNA-binding SARP family transcriptional activator